MVGGREKKTRGQGSSSFSSKPKHCRRQLSQQMLHVLSTVSWAALGINQALNDLVVLQKDRLKTMSSEMKLIKGNNRAISSLSLSNRDIPSFIQGML
jgi:hypothetical protein